jgi:hypothetical protein
MFQVETRAQYVVLNGPRSRIQMLVCFRSPENVQKLQKKPDQEESDNKKAPLFTKESCKLSSCCLARMYVRRKASGEVAVEHIASHSGHNQGPWEEQRFLKLSEHVHRQIEEQLKLGIPTDRIVRNCNAALSNRSVRKDVIKVNRVFHLQYMVNIEYVIGRRLQRPHGDY